MGHEITSFERHRLALSMKEGDRIPVAPSFLTRTVKEAGVCQYDYHNDPEVLAFAQINHCEKYDFDGLFISSDNLIMYEALGGKIIFKDKHSYPFWTNPLISNSKDLARLKVPDPSKDGRMPLIIEASHIAMDKVGKKRVVLSNIDSGPFQLAATIMGIQHAMILLIENPKEMKQILKFCSNVTVAYGIAMAKSGCHGLQFGESTVTLFSRALYEEIVWPYDCYVIRELNKLGIFVFFHVCGDSNSIIDLMAQTGADCLEIDSQVNMADAKKKVGSKVTLKGNIHTSNLMSRSVEEIRCECKAIINGGKEGGGFILAAGCEFPSNCSDKLVRAVRDSADMFGKYSNSEDR